VIEPELTFRFFKAGFEGPAQAGDADQFRERRRLRRERQIEGELVRLAAPVIKICMAAFIRSLAAVLFLCRGNCRGASRLPRKVIGGAPASAPKSPVMNTFTFHNRLFVLTLDLGTLAKRFPRGNAGEK
jgi:hypothetical protein